MINKSDQKFVVLFEMEGLIKFNPFHKKIFVGVTTTSVLSTRGLKHGLEEDRAREGGGEEEEAGEELKMFRSNRGNKHILFPSNLTFYLRDNP